MLAPWAHICIPSWHLAHITDHGLYLLHPLTPTPMLPSLVPVQGLAQCSHSINPRRMRDSQDRSYSGVEGLVPFCLGIQSSHVLLLTPYTAARGCH